MMDEVVKMKNAKNVGFRVGFKTIVVVVSVMVCSFENPLKGWYLGFETEEPIRSLRITVSKEKKELKIENMMCNHGYRNSFSSMVKVEDTYDDTAIICIQIGNTYKELSFTYKPYFKAILTGSIEEKNNIKVFFSHYEAGIPFNSTRSVFKSSLKYTWND